MTAEFAYADQGNGSVVGFGITGDFWGSRFSAGGPVDYDSGDIHQRAQVWFEKAAV